MMNIVFICPHCKNNTIGVFPTFLGNTHEGLKYDVTCEICLNQTEIILEPKEYAQSKPIHDAGLDEIFLN